MRKIYLSFILSWCWMAGGFFYYSEGRIYISTAFFYLAFYSRNSLYRRLSKRRKTAFTTKLFMLIVTVLLPLYIIFNWKLLMYRGLRINKWLIKYFYCIFIPFCAFFLYKDYRFLSAAAEITQTGKEQKTVLHFLNRPSKPAFLFEWIVYNGLVFYFCFHVYNWIGPITYFRFLDLSSLLFGLFLGTLQWYILRKFIRIHKSSIVVYSIAWVSAVLLSNTIMSISGRTCCNLLELYLIGTVSEHYCCYYGPMFFGLLGLIIGVFHFFYFKGLSRNSDFMISAYPAGFFLGYWVLEFFFYEFQGNIGSLPVLLIFSIILFIPSGLAMSRSLEFNQFKFCPLNGYTFPRHS